jgi:Domain of unknown function (DUF4276)
MNIVTIGFYTEGTTDDRFLHSIIKRTFDSVALECASEIEVYEPEIITGTADTFPSTIVAVARAAGSQGATVLCIHTDADARTGHDVFTHKIIPARTAIEAAQLTNAPVLVAVVPVHMSEAWILADKELLKNEMGTSSSNRDLGLDRAPEAYADPKAAIEEAIRRVFEHRSRRHRQQVSLHELYLPLGQKIALNLLVALPSYQKFRAEVQEAFRQLNYLH